MAGEKFKKLLKIKKGVKNENSLNMKLRSLFCLTLQPIYKNNIIESWDIILPRDKLSYKADQGFIYRKNAQSNYKDIPLTPGSYKCAVADEDNDDTNEEPPVMINLQDGYAPVMEQSLRNTVSHGAFVNYTVFEDRKTFQVICCSSSSVPPDMYMISCTSKTMCDRHQRVFSKLVWFYNISRFYI